MHAPSLTGWNGGYRKSIPCILFVKFLTFEQESIKAKLDNNSVRQGLRKGSLQFDIHNDLLPSDTRESVQRMAAPRLLLLLTVSLHLQPLHTKYLLVQTLDIFGAIKRSGLAYFYYPAKKWKNMVKNDCSVNITNPCTLGSPYPSHKILIQCKV